MKHEKQKKMINREVPEVLEQEDNQNDTIK